MNRLRALGFFDRRSSGPVSSPESGIPVPDRRHTYAESRFYWGVRFAFLRRRVRRVVSFAFANLKGVAPWRQKQS